jgi:hypothetical protein
MPVPLDPECLFAVLATHDVDYVLVGGIAAVLHGSPTTTTDVDILPRAEASNLARLADALRDLAARVRSLDDTEGVPFDPHPTLLASVGMLNMTTRCGDLDLTFRPAGLGEYDEVMRGAIEIDLGDLVVHVASLDDIIRSKTAADRPKDRAVLPVLEALREEIRTRSAD